MRHRFDARTTFRWDLEEVEESPGPNLPHGGHKFENGNLIPVPDRLPGAYKFKIVATMTSDGPQLAHLKFRDTQFYLQFRPGATVGDMNRTVTKFLNNRGQGGDFAVEAEALEPIDFGRTYEVQGHQARQLGVILKQTEMAVEENERWYTVSERIAAAFGMPRWSVFRMYAVDGAIRKIGRGDLVYSFDWIGGKEYWLDNVDDLGLDLRTGQGREIKIIDGLGRVDTLALRRGTTVEVIKEFWRKTCSFPVDRLNHLVRDGPKLDNLLRSVQDHGWEPWFFRR
jgi:hypothetical protein